MTIDVTLTLIAKIVSSEWSAFRTQSNLPNLRSPSDMLTFTAEMANISSQWLSSLSALNSGLQFAN
jgi:hypothetical protein